MEHFYSKPVYVSYRLGGLVRVQTGFGCRSQCVGGVEGTGVGGGGTQVPLATESWAAACGFV